MLNSSLKRLKSYFRLTETTSVTSFLFPWAIVLCLVSGVLTSLCGPHSSCTFAGASSYSAGQRSAVPYRVGILVSSTVMGTSHDIYEESIILFN